VFYLPVSPVPTVTIRVSLSAPFNQCIFIYLLTIKIVQKYTIKLKMYKSTQLSYETHKHSRIKLISLLLKPVISRSLSAFYAQRVCNHISCRTMCIQLETLRRTKFLLIDASLDKGKSKSVQHNWASSQIVELTLLKYPPCRETNLTILFSPSTHFNTNTARRQSSSSLSGKVFVTRANKTVAVQHHNAQQALLLLTSWHHSLTGYTGKTTLKQ